MYAIIYGAYFFEGFYFMNNVLFLDDDKRTSYAANYLKKKNIKCDIIAISELYNINLSSYNFITLPIPTRDEKISSYLKNQILITGNYASEYKKHIDICKRKDFMLLNAVPTAEAAISIAIENIDSTLWESKILIIGNGCIGKILSNRLKSFSKEITITARKSEDFSYIQAHNYNFCETKMIKNEIEKYDIVFNTVPYPVLSQDEVLQCKSSCVLIELSSAPFGIDKDAAQKHGIKYVYAPGLPGKYFPKTAGEILGKCIHNIINEKLFRSDC